MKLRHIGILLAVIAIDQISKYASETYIALHERISVIPGFFNLTSLRNTGAAWSMLEGKMWFFYIITVIALIVLFQFYRNQTDNEWIQIALVLMIGGTIGNFIDRLLFQYVRDFLDFIIFGYDFPVFNIADASLCIGVFLILADVMMENMGMVHK